LEHYGKDLTEEELRTYANMMTIPIDLSSEANNADDIFDSYEPQSKQTSSKGRENMNFEVSNIVDEVLEIGNDNN
ncbi:3051_t:CDS:2, partial [Racocetra fulgida]